MSRQGRNCAKLNARIIEYLSIMTAQAPANHQLFFGKKEYAKVNAHSKPVLIAFYIFRSVLIACNTVKYSLSLSIPNQSGDVRNSYEYSIASFLK